MLAIRTLAAIISGLGSKPPGLLDLYPGSAIAFSTKLLSVSYIGYCANVRRSTDNLERDIPFKTTPDANGLYWLDEVKLLEHVGTGDGFIVTWYDQSGWSFNATNYTAATQPRIVTAGVVNKNTAGKLAIRFFGDQVLYVPGAKDICRNIGSAYVFSVFERSVAQDCSIFTVSTSLGIQGRVAQLVNPSILFSYFRRLDSDGLGQNEQPAPNNYGQFTGEFQFSAGAIVAYVNNVSGGATAITAGLTSNTASMYDPTIGTNAGGAQRANGNLSELLVYTSNQSANRSAIAQAQMTTFGVTP